MRLTRARGGPGRLRRAGLLVLASALAWAALVAGTAPAAGDTERFAMPEDAVAAGVLDSAVLDALRSDGQTTAIVSLDDRELLARAAAAEASGAGREQIVAEIGAAAVAAREGAMTELAAHGGEVLFAYDHLPAALVRLSGEPALVALVNRPEVTRIHAEVVVAPTTVESGVLVRQPQAVALGHTGAGTSVAVLDSGVDHRRAAFGVCAVGMLPTCRVAVSRDIAADDGQADDASLHGTNVSGIVAAIAPAARLVVLDVVRSDGTAVSSDIMRAIDWLIANAAAAHNVNAMNLSLGGGSYGANCPPDPGFRVALAAGIVPVAASGNGGQTTGVGWPACVADAIAVGAVYDANVGQLTHAGCTDASTAPDRVACFSQAGPNLDMLAPGAIITAAGISMAGTSQAAPHVAAAAAMLTSLAPEASAAHVRATLLNNGPLVTDPRTGVATRRLDIQAAVTALHGVNAGAPAPSAPPPSAPPPPPPSSPPSPGPGGHPFTDIDSSPFTSDIVWIYERGITRGCAPDRFCPTAPVLRDQMASFMVRAFELPPTTLDFFTDDEGNLHEPAINRLAAAGVSLGCATRRYCPSGEVTREQMASFLVRALSHAGRTAATTRDHFGDDEGSVHEPDINRLAAAGITRGCTETEFCPRQVVTREQMAAFVRRSLD